MDSASLLSDLPIFPLMCFVSQGLDPLKYLH